MRTLTTIGLLQLATFACRTEKSITVQNPAPNADIISHDNGSVILEGISTVFVGSVMDANHTPDQLTTIWYVNGDVACDEAIPNETGETTCEVVLGLDDSVVTLAVRDLDNSRSEDSITISIEPSQSPEAQILSPVVDGVYYFDQLIEFEGVVSDAEDDVETLSVRWVSTLDGDLTGIASTVNTSGEVVGFGSLSEGEHAIQLFVTDSTGNETQESVIIDVGPPNSAPLCEVLSPVDGSGGAMGETVEFTATASDVDVNSDLLMVEWSSDKDGVLGSSTPSTDGDIAFSFSDLSVNTHTITLQVSDELGESCTKFIEYTVGTAPSISIDGPIDGELLNEGEPIAFTAFVTDSEDQPDDITLDWSLNGSNFSTQAATSSGTATFSDDTLGYGSYNLVVTATDPAGLTDVDQINFTVNGVPSAPVVNLTPVSPTTTETLVVSIVTPSIDPEGTTPTYSYEWQLGGQTQSTHIASSISSSATLKGEQWTVVVTPNDGLTDGIPAQANSVTIVNTAPVLTSVVVTPNPAIAGTDDLTCDVTATDVDGDPIVYTYEWSDSNGVQQTMTEVSDVSDVFLTGGLSEDAWTCEVTPYDGTDYGVSDSASVTVETGCPIEGDGSAVDCPAIDCARILDDGYSTGDGQYWIDPDGQGPIEVYCDMTTDGGGWTLVSKFSQSTGIGGLLESTYESYFRVNAWIKGENVTPPQNPNSSTSPFAIGSVDWRRMMNQNEGYQIRQHFFKDSNLFEFDVAYNFTYNGFVTQNDTSVSEERAWDLTERTVLLDNTGIVWDLPTETTRFWLPFFDGINDVGYTACNGYSFDDYYCNKDALITRRYGNTGIIGEDTDDNDPAASWAPHTNSSLSYHDIVYVHQDVSTYGQSSDNMTLLYWIRQDLSDDDQDGVLAWEDCDDTDGTVSDPASGTSENCAAISCRDILDDGYSTGDGTYWVNPEGSDAWEVYCDMTTDGGGWTLASVVRDTNGSAEKKYPVNGMNEANLAVNNTTDWASFSQDQFNQLFNSQTDTIMRVSVDHLNSLSSGDLTGSSRTWYLQKLNYSNFDAFHAIRYVPEWGTHLTSYEMDYTRAGRPNPYDAISHDVSHYAGPFGGGMQHWENHTLTVQNVDYTVSRHGIVGDIYSNCEWLYVNYTQNDTLLCCSDDGSNFATIWLK